MGRLFVRIILFVLVWSTILKSAIIADHHAVKQFSSIPQQYIDSAKSKMLYIVGESHATSFGYGLELLASRNKKYPAVAAMISTIEYAGNMNPSYPSLDPQNPKLRMIRGYGGEDAWFAAGPSANTMLPFIEQYSKQGVSVIGFGWCWDMLWEYEPVNRSASIDPVYRCHWYGRSEMGPQGDRAWGLDAEDSIITGNSVNIGTYLKVTQNYVDSCRAKGLKIKVMFTTGPVDTSYVNLEHTKEQAYQRELKHTKIREWIESHPDNILFDFADILCYDDNGKLTTDTWTDDRGVVHTYPTFNPANGSELNSAYHFQEQGAIRIAKAVWWMMAKLSGWDKGIVHAADNRKKSSTFGGDVNFALGKTTLHINASNPVRMDLYTLSGVLHKSLEINKSGVTITKPSIGMYVYKLSDLENRSNFQTSGRILIK